MRSPSSESLERTITDTTTPLSANGELAGSHNFFNPISLFYCVSLYPSLSESLLAEEWYAATKLGLTKAKGLQSWEPGFESRSEWATIVRVDSLHLSSLLRLEQASGLGDSLEWPELNLKTNHNRKIEKSRRVLQITLA